jgi:hypothetical protein
MNLVYAAHVSLAGLLLLFVVAFIVLNHRRRGKSS